MRSKKLSQALALAYVFAQQLAAFYAVAALFGFIYAGTMPLYSVLVRENFPLRMLGTSRWQAHSAWRPGRWRVV